MKTWSRADDALLPRVRYARQNGVPLLERDPRSGEVEAGRPPRTLGGGQLVGLAGLQAAVGAGRGRPAGGGRTALPRLRVLLERDAIGDGPGLRRLPLPVRHAPRHERPRAHLPRALPREGGQARRRAPRSGHERPRQDVRQRRPSPAFSRFADNRDFFYLMKKREPRRASRGPVREGAPPAAVSRGPRSPALRGLVAALAVALLSSAARRNGPRRAERGALPPARRGPRVLPEPGGRGAAHLRTLAVRRPGQSRDLPAPPQPRGLPCCALPRSPSRTRTALFEKICGGTYMAPLYDPREGGPGAGPRLHRPVRVPRHPLRVPGRLDPRERGRPGLRGARQAALRRARVGRGLRGRAPAARLSIRPRAGTSTRHRRSAGCAPPTTGRSSRTRSWSYGPAYRTGSLRDLEPQDPGLPGRRLGLVRLEHLPRRLLSRVPQPARRLRPERQRRGAHEPAARREPDGEPRQPDARRHRDEGKLVRLRRLPGARGLVPVARPLLARDPGPGPEEPRELPPRIPLLQEPPSRGARAGRPGDGTATGCAGPRRSRRALRSDSLVAQQPDPRRIFQDVEHGARLAVHEDRVAHQADAVAVVGVPRAVNGAQRLDRRPVRVEPAVDRDPSRVIDARRGVITTSFLVPGDERARRQAAALLLDGPVVRPEVGDRGHRRPGGHRPRFELRLRPGDGCCSRSCGSAA